MPRLVKIASLSCLPIWLLLVARAAVGQQSAPQITGSVQTLPRLVLTLDGDGVTRRTIHKLTTTRGLMIDELLTEKTVVRELELVTYQERDVTELRSKLYHAGAGVAACESFRQQVETTLLPHQIAKLNQFLQRYPCYCYGIIAQAKSDQAGGLGQLRYNELTTLAQALERIRQTLARNSEQLWSRMNRDAVQILSAQQRRTLREMVDQAAMKAPCPLPEIIMIQLASRKRPHIYTGLKPGFAQMAERTEFHLRVDGGLKSVPKCTPVDVMFNLMHAMDESGIQLDHAQRARLREFLNALMREYSTASLAVLDQLEKKQITAAEAKTALAPITTRLVTQALGFLEVELLDPPQFGKLKRLAASRTLAERGLLAALQSGDLGRVMLVSEAQKTKLDDLAEKYLADFVALVRNAEIDVWATAAKSLDPDHRQVWTKRVGAGAWSHVRTAPSLLLYDSARTGKSANGSPAGDKNQAPVKGPVN